jgi:hypothetical protein
MTSLPDAFNDPMDLYKLMQLAESGFLDAFESLLNHPGVINEQVMPVDEVRRKLRENFGLDKAFVCCLCSKQAFGWGHNPDPCCTDDDARCCGLCNSHRVIPARISEATRQHAVVSKTK